MEDRNPLSSVWALLSVVDREVPSHNALGQLIGSIACELSRAGAGGDDRRREPALQTEAKPLSELCDQARQLLLLMAGETNSASYSDEAVAEVRAVVRRKKFGSRCQELAEAIARR